MANWIKTFVRLQGKKEELDTLKSMMTYKYGGENYEVNQNFFNSLVPMPSKLPELDWLYENWGTCTEADELWFNRSNEILLELSFESSWSTPALIFKAITKQFPSIVLGGYFADEAMGFNCGLIMGRGDQISVADVGDGSQESIEFAEKVWGMVADEEYVGEKLETFYKRPTPTDFVEVGLVEDE